MMTFPISVENTALRLAESIREVTASFALNPTETGWLDV